MGENGDRDSEEVLLEAMQGSAPSVAPTPCEDSDPDSAKAAQERQERMVETWGLMAEKMVCVVRTIQKNEVAMANWTKHMKRLVLAVWVAMALAVLAAFYLAMQAEQAINNLHRQTVGAMDKMAAQQKATLTAVTKLGEAMGKKLEADVAPSPEADDEAQVAALEAQKAALEATKKVSDNPSDRADAERKIRKVEQRKQGRKTPADKEDFDSKVDRY